MKDEGLLDYDLAYQALEHLTTSRVVYYLLHVFHSAEEEIYYQEDSTTPVKLAFILGNCRADRISVWFRGGPPDKEDWFEGTLLTMLIDRLFYAVVTGYNNMVNEFLKVLNGSSGKNVVRYSV